MKRQSLSAVVILVCLALFAGLLLVLSWHYWGAAPEAPISSDAAQQVGLSADDQEAPPGSKTGLESDVVEVSSQTTDLRTRQGVVEPSEPSRPAPEPATDDGTNREPVNPPPDPNPEPVDPPPDPSPEPAGEEPEEEPGDAILDGRVVDAQFQSVEAAEVVATEGTSAAAYSRTSGADGRFSFDGIRAGRYQLQATKDGAEGRAGPVVAGGDLSPSITIVLGANSSIGGQVLDLDSRDPVPGILLRAWEATEGHSNEGRSDAAGHFRIPVPSPGAYQVYSSRNPNHVDGALTLNVPLAAGEHKDDVLYTIQRGIRLEGTVTAGDTPAPDATVQLVDLRNDQGGNRGETVSDPDGHFAFTGKKPGGRYVARAVHPEHGFGESLPVTTGMAGAQGRLHVRLQPGTPVQGRLHTADGAGVPGIPVWLLKQDGQPWRPIPGTRVVSADNGTFLMRGVPPGAWQFVVVTASTSRLTSGSFTVVEGEEVAPVDIDLGTGVEGFIEGHVRSPEGEPLPRVEVIAHPSQVRLSGVNGTDQDGHYRIEGLGPALSYNVRARGYRLGRFRKSQSAIPVNSSGVDFVLGKMSTISGRVVDQETGQPVQSFHVAGRLVNRDFESPDGVFVIDNIQISEEIFRFSAPGYLTAVYDPGGVPEGGAIAGVLVELGPPGWLEGRVTAASTGAPVQGARVKLIIPGVLPVEMVEREFFWDASDPYTDAAGRFILAAHPEGQPNSFVVAYADHVPYVVTDSMERTFEIVLEQAPE